MSKRPFPSPGGIVAAIIVAGLSLAGVSLLVARGSPPLPYETSLPTAASSYDPRAAGEQLPRGFRQVLPRDAIRPIYTPRFVTAAESRWRDDVMVIGVELDGIAKAYPVSLLNRREMVNDQLAQLPILVTWWPLCATAMVHRREIDGRDILFGNHGAMLGSAMTWWDHETGSIWS